MRVIREEPLRGGHTRSGHRRHLSDGTEGDGELANSDKLEGFGFSNSVSSFCHNHVGITIKKQKAGTAI